MKHFELTSSMLTLGGIFYPRGYAFVMFPSAQEAEQVARELEGEQASEAMLLDPKTILREIGKVSEDAESDVQLPSVGTEGVTVRKYVELARAGHHALMIKVDSDEAAESLMESARKGNFSYGQRYQLLAMQDLE